MHTTVTALQPGDAIGRYVLDGRLGAGGFGEVWRAHLASRPAEPVALKIADDPTRARALLAEARIPARIASDRIVRALDVDATGPVPYLVLEYVEGTSLRERLAQGRLPAAEACRIAREILLALLDAHRAGFCHLDLKPENVLIARSGRVKLTDFGLGAPLDGLVESAGLGSSKAIAGTIPYLAPERRDGRGADHRADLYAFGVILFEMICGERPAGTELPSDLVPGVPAAVDEVFRRSYCRLDARARTAEVLLDLLPPATGRPAAAAPPSSAAILVGEAEARLILGPHGDRLASLVDTRRLEAAAASEAGRLFDPADVRRVARALDDERDAAPSGSLRPAHLRRRVIAFTIDLLFVLAVVLLVVAPLPPSGLPGGNRGVGVLILGALYVWLLPPALGRTLGQALLRVRVVRENGGRMGVLRSFIRTAAFSLSVLPLGMGFLIAAFDPRGRTLHDLVAGTVAVRAPAKP